MKQDESSGTEQSGDNGNRGGFETFSLPTSFPEELFCMDCQHNQDTGMSRDKSPSLLAATSKELSRRYNNSSSLKHVLCPLSYVLSG